MMLDMKRTFDDVVVAHSAPDRAQQILDNPFYQALSSSFAGTQEYMAMEKLGQLRATDQWDLIIVDTPPSRSALDFLDAPNRMSRFLDGTMIRLLTAPARAGGRAGMRIMSGRFTSRRMRALQERGEGETTGVRWARFVTRNPVKMLLVSVVGLGVLAIPALSMQQESEAPRAPGK